jgi:enoyl-CoA hydratase
MAEQHLLVSTHDYVTTMTINRPEKRNALTYAFLQELKTTLANLADDPRTRVVVLHGAGEKAFSSGLDMGSVLSGVTERPEAPIDHELIHTAMQAVDEHPNPVIAMINGDAFAGGCELALHCDFRLMVESARIGMPLVKRGLMIPFQLVQKLVHMVGPIGATEVLLRGAPLSATRAQELGLVNQVLPRQRLKDETASLAAELAANAPLAMRGFKVGIARAVQPDADRYQHDMHALMVRVMGSEDAREGLQAFLEKRPPQYTGR